MDRQREADGKKEEEATRAKTARMEAARVRLYSLVVNGQLQGLRQLVNDTSVENGERAELINADDTKGGVILHQAAYGDDLPMVRWILSDSGGRAAGFNKVLAKDSTGRTALHIAVDCGLFEVFLAIVEGCKVENGERAEMLNALDGNSASVLYVAATVESEEIVDWLLSEKGREAGFNRDNLFALNINNESVLHYAVANLSVECLDRILGQCKDAEERCRLLFGVDKNGWTVVLYAANNISALQWVVSRQQEERGNSNEDLFALTNDKQSVLHVAARGGSVESFDFIVSRCSNSSERLRLLLGRDDKGWTIFHHAARHSEGEMITHILLTYPEESKIIINTRDREGMTALHRRIIGFPREDKSEEWEEFGTDGETRAAVVALLGFEDDEDEEDSESEDDDEEDGSKKPIDGSRVITTAVAADPNVGLKFE